MDRYLGRIYVGTAEGVDRLEPESGRIRHFTPEDGLGQGRILASLRASDGKLWFASEQALARFDPEPPAGKPRATYLSSPASGFEVPYNRSYFEAEFSSPGYTGAGVRFQYRLDGQDSDWGAPVAESVVRYAGMAPGSYRLLARAVNAEGDVSDQTAVLAFTVLPPFWQTWWFLTLVLAAVAAGLYAAHKYRVGRILAVERVRTRIASDLHDDIGATLSQVSMLGELAQRSLRGSMPGTAELIERMSSASRDAIAAMSDIVWSIHPDHDRLGDLALRMRRFGSDLLSARDIDFELALPGEETHLLPLEARRDLLLIFKESVHNAARHSGCSRVLARLGIQDGAVELTVEDDGRGLAAGPAGAGGNGLRTMRMRAEKLGGVFEAGPAGAGGTRVLCRVPLGRE